MLFEFRNNLYGINKVEMMVCDDKWNEQIVAMDYDGELWIQELHMNSEKIVYRYKINERAFTINDPEADYYIKDSSMMVWSVKNNRENNNRVNDKIKPIMRRCVITDRVINSIGECKLRKRFVTSDTKKIAVGINLSNVSEVHAVSIIWFQPDGRIYCLDERTIESLEEVEVNVWFWLKVDDMKGNFYKGIWAVEVFIDGRSAIKDNFIISDKRDEEYIGFSCTA